MIRMSILFVFVCREKFDYDCTMQTDTCTRNQNHFHGIMHAFDILSIAFFVYTECMLGLL